MPFGGARRQPRAPAGRRDDEPPTSTRWPRELGGDAALARKVARDARRVRACSPRRDAARDRAPARARSATTTRSSSPTSTATSTTSTACVRGPPPPVRRRRRPRGAAERGGVLSERGYAWPPLALISWPFEFGEPDVGMGAGASLLAGDRELHDALASAGWTPTLERVPPAARSRRRDRQDLRPAARARRRGRARRSRRGAFPLVLSGGCISASATVAGARAGARARRRLDGRARRPRHARGQPVGLDGRPGAVAADRRRVAGRVRDDPGLHAAGRGGGPAATASATSPTTNAYAFEASAVADVRRRGARDAADPRLPSRRPRRARHRRRPRQPLRRAGGPSLEAVLATIDATFDHATVVAAALTAYEPRPTAPGDPRGRARHRDAHRRARAGAALDDRALTLVLLGEHAVGDRAQVGVQVAAEHVAQQRAQVPVSSASSALERRRRRARGRR